ADLAITKDNVPDAVGPGDTLTYVVTVTNRGPQDALGVVVTDVLPPEVSFVSDTDSCSEGPPGTLTCSLRDIAAGSSKSFDIQVKVDPNLVASACEPVFITNTASVASFSADPDPSNNSTTLETRIVFPLDHFQCHAVDQIRFPQITGLSL